MVIDNGRASNISMEKEGDVFVQNTDTGFVRSKVNRPDGLETLVNDRPGSSPLPSSLASPLTDSLTANTLV